MEQMKLQEIKDICIGLKLRQILQIMLQFTSKAAYAEPLLQGEIDSVERVLFPASMVALGFHHVPLARHYVNERWARARIGMNRDSGSGHLTSIDHCIHQCLMLAEELQRSYDEQVVPSADKAMFCAYGCFNRILPVLGMARMDLEIECSRFRRRNPVKPAKELGDTHGA